MSLARNLLTVLTGRLVAQALVVISAPILTRIFAPEHFGVVTLLTSAAMVLRPLSLLRYEMALAQVRDEAEAGALAGLCVLLGLGTTALFTAIALTAAAPIAGAFAAPELRLLVLLLPAVALAQSVASAANQWAAFRQRFGPVARAGVAQTLIQRGLPIPYGLLLGPSGLGLYLGMLLGQIAGAIGSIGPFLRDIRAHLTLDRARIRNIASLHKNFPLHLTPFALLDLLGSSMPGITLGWFWSIAHVGWFGQAYGLLNLPLALFIDSVGRTFYPHLAKVHHGAGELATPMRRMVTVLADLGTYPLAAVVVAGPALFALVLGEDFRESGHLARWMVPLFLPWLLWSPVSVAVNVLGRQRALLLQTVALTALRVAALLVPPLLGAGLLTTIALWAASAGLFMSGQLVWILRVCGVSPAEAARLLLTRVAVAAACVAPAAATLELHVASTFAALAAGGLAYGAWALRANPDLAATARRALRRG